MAGRYSRIRRLVASVISAVLALTLINLSEIGTTPANAIAGSEFDAGNIISDHSFYNGAAMSEAEIQQFLQAKVGSCANSNCLADYRTDTPTRTWSFGTCSTYTGAPGESAARIIFKVQQACGLSAKVILVTLQKEQSLVTNPAPAGEVMRKAMGYGCPDTSVCDSTYYGFFNQVFAAARQLTWYSNPAGSFTSIKIGQANSIRYNPDATCGSKSVVVQNRATAALYYYTPYTPNAAALANLYGTGDNCSAYGNRNFWVFYSNWFGSPIGDTSPLGVVEVRSGGIGGIRVGGWALDPDTREAIEVHVYVDGVGARTIANIPRPDVGAIYGLGDLHGFDLTVPVTSSGQHSVCVYALNVGSGSNTVLGCMTIVAQGGPPMGSLESVKVVNGAVEVGGWAIDPDTANPISVHIYVGAAGVAVTADLSRPDIGAAHPGYGDRHGFSRSIPAPAGTSNVCAYAINVAAGNNVLLGCRSVTVVGEQGRAPFGFLEAVQGVAGGVEVSGWAIDPDTTASIAVHLYVDGWSGGFVADKLRSDVGAAYAGYGDAHGYREVLTATPGSHRVCAYAINAGPGPHTLLGCRDVTVP